MSPPNLDLMYVRILDEARADLRSVESFIKQDNPAAAQRVITAILTTINQLESFPFSGRPGREPDTREIPVPGAPYFVVYTLPDEYRIDIEAVFHARQKYPPTGP